MRAWLVAAAAVAILPLPRALAAGGGILDFGDGAAPQPEKCFNLTFDELSWAAGDTTFFTDDMSSSDYFTQFGVSEYGGLGWSNLQVKSNASSMWSPNAAASLPNVGVSWIATPVVALAARGAFRPVAVQAAVQAFFPLPPGPGAAPPRPPATLTVWSVRAGNKASGGGPEFAACATAALPYPASPADAQIGPRVPVDLAACGPASAGLVFGLTDRLAFFDAPNNAYLSDTYFVIDDVAVCAAGGGAGSVSPPPPSIYLQSPPVGFANKRRRRRSGRRRVLLAEEGKANNGTANATAAAAAPPSFLQAALGPPPAPPRPGYVAGAAQAAGGGAAPSSSSAVSPALAAAALTSAPRTAAATPANASAADRAASTAAAVAAGGGGGCFAQGFDALAWRPTVNHTLDTDSYVSYYAPLVDGAGLAWVNAAVVKDAAPPRGATSPLHYARPRFPGPLYAFAQAGTFRPVAVSVSPRCEATYPLTPVDPALCPGPVGPPPVFEVAALKAGGLDGVSGAELRVCATAALGAPPLPPPGPGPTGTGEPVVIDLSPCGPAVLALRFRLVPPFQARETSFALDDLIVCPGDGGGGKGGGGGGKSSVKAPAAGAVTELPVVDPPAWPGTLLA